MKTILIVPVLIFAVFVSPSVALSAGKKDCDFNKKAIPSKLKKWSDEYTKNHKPTSKYRKKDMIAEKKVEAILYNSWRAFGVQKSKARKNAKLNLKQAWIESSLRGNAEQALCDVNGCPGDPTVAGGLFQFIPATFNRWKVKGFNNRFNPLSNAIAVVNAQINAKFIYTDGPGSRKIKVLAGQGSWGAVGGANYCR